MARDKVGESPFSRLSDCLPADFTEVSRGIGVKRGHRPDRGACLAVLADSVLICLYGELGGVIIILHRIRKREGSNDSWRHVVEGERE